MDIQQLIKHRIFDCDFFIFDTNGDRYNVDQFRQEYIALRNNFQSTYKNTGGIGIKLKKNPRFLMTILACMEVGIPYVPMRENYPETRVHQIKDETNFDFLLTEENFEEVIASRNYFFTEPDHKKMDTLYTICTSGSTGKPKAVVVSRTSIHDFWKWCDSFFVRLNSNDKILQVADFTFDISLIDIGLFLTKGAHLHFSKFTGNIFTLALEIENKRITFINTVVNNFSMLLEEAVYSRADFSSLHTVVMGGARFTTGLYNKCVENFSNIDVINLYGVTEVPVYSHAKRMSFDESDINNCNISIGQPLGSTTSIIVKEDVEVLQGEKGELLLGGGQLMKYYANDPEMTDQVFTEINGTKYYKTGDISYKSKEGDYFITGRMDDTIKYRGYRINLLDIDAYIQTLSYVEHAVTFAIPNELTQNTTICYIKLNKNSSIKNIKKDLSEILLDYQIPEKLLIVDSFPINDNGKICKKTLRSYHLEVK